ncbi:organic cation transporter protein-like isoform X1 [Penaeus chinensis]|uniref:organic cation transporter protein-like isoform X1 n=2 Tax=Penaeus chinensis TaxID=139456 RepID=UPI001FB693E3|nr:organic cation transporter protein-like isoform X1 [Penaeus chinensis]
MGVKLDGLLTQLGTGKWNILHCLALSYCVSLPAYHTLGGAFLAPKVDYACRPPDYAHTNKSVTAYGMDGTDFQDDCSFFAKSPVTGRFDEKKCTQWVFDNSTFTSSVTSEFQLVCGRGYLRATFTSIYMFGVLVGAPLNGLLADKYGRRPTVAIGSLLYSIIAIGSCWLPTLSILMIARFLLGTMHPTIMKTGYILAMEVTEPRLRSVMGIMLFLPWALGTMAWGGIAYLVRDWRWLQLTVSLLTLIFLPALLFMDESPRWLVVRGYHGLALRTLQKAARWNKASLPPPHRILQILKDGQHEVHPTKRHNADDACSFNGLIRMYVGSAFILFRTPRLRIITLCMYIDYLIVGMVYYGLSLGGGNFSSDPFIYMVLMGVMEVPAYTVMVPVVTSFGRRAPTVFFFLFSGAVLLCLPFIPLGCGWLAVTLAMIGKMMITSAFQIIALYCSELFPTEVRTRGASTAFMMSRLGSTCSPFITEYLGAAYPWAPSVVFGVSSIVAGLATLALPETLGVALPDTIAHLEERAALGAKRMFIRMLTREYNSGLRFSPALTRPPRLTLRETSSIMIQERQEDHPRQEQNDEAREEEQQEQGSFRHTKPTKDEASEAPRGEVTELTTRHETEKPGIRPCIEPSRFMWLEPMSSSSSKSGVFSGK